MNALATLSDLSPLNHQRVAERAYGIWQAEGRPTGQAVEHWAWAEREERACQDKSQLDKPLLAT